MCLYINEMLNGNAFWVGTSGIIRLLALGQAKSPAATRGTVGQDERGSTAANSPQIPKALLADNDAGMAWD